ncbi:MAG: D-alanine--D-alanine ligase [Polyangiaceae bacterium]
MPHFSIAVVQGGPSPEAEVSRASAAGIATALGELGHRAVRLELNAFLAESLRTGGYDVVFPAVHGAVGEDGSLQGLLEVLDLPYVGSGVLASALAMEKRQARVAFAAAELPIAKGTVALRGREDASAAAKRALRDVSPRLVVKPSTGGSAIGVSRFAEGASEAEIARAIEQVWELSDAALLEHFARGREVTCGVLDLGTPTALPPTEITSPHDPFYTYEARYAPGRSVHATPAPLGMDLIQRVQSIAAGAHAALGCRDLSRVDFVVGDGNDPSTITLLEVNTLPGFTATSLFPEAAAVAGIPLPKLVDLLVRAAHARGPTRRSAPLPLPK